MSGKTCHNIAHNGNGRYFSIKNEVQCQQPFISSVMEASPAESNGEDSMQKDKIHALRYISLVRDSNAVGRGYYCPTATYRGIGGS